jgi:hypothetical protein
VSDAAAKLFELKEPRHAWRDEVLLRLNELVRLPRGWDGYSAEPVSFANAQFALRLLETILPPNVPTPQIVPGTSGDLQIEWHTRTGDMELHVQAPNHVHAWRALADGDADGEELHLTTDFSELVVWLKAVTEASRATKSAAA